MEHTVEFNNLPHPRQYKVNKSKLIGFILNYLDYYEIGYLNVQIGARTMDIFQMNIEEIDPTMKIIVYTYKIIKDPRKLLFAMDEIYNSVDYKKISKQKPVATLNSGDQTWFYKNYERFSIEEKNTFKRMLSDITGMTIEINDSENFCCRILFYDPTYLMRLSDVFGHSLAKSIEILTTYREPEERTKQINALINIAFGDYYREDKEKYMLCKTEEEKEYFDMMCQIYNSSI